MALAYRAPRTTVFKGRSDTPGPGARPEPAAPCVGFLCGILVDVEAPEPLPKRRQQTPAPGDGVALAQRSTPGRPVKLHSGSKRMGPCSRQHCFQASSVKDNPGPGTYQVRPAVTERLASSRPEGGTSKTLGAGSGKPKWPMAER